MFDHETVLLVSFRKKINKNVIDFRHQEGGCERMRFSVNIRALADASQNMQLMIRQINNQIQETEDIAASVRRVTSYDEVVRSLKRQIDYMNAEKQQLAEMMSALNQIQKIYRTGEEHILDYGDEVKQRNSSYSRQVVSLKELKSRIQVFHIR